MSAPRPAQSVPRRDPIIMGAIEALQDADDAMRLGRDPSIELIAAQACITTLIERALKGAK